MTQPLHSPLGGIALNAIRWRSGEPDIGYAILRDDVRWLLRYIAEAEAAAPDPVASPALDDMEGALHYALGHMNDDCDCDRIWADIHRFHELSVEPLPAYEAAGQPVAEEPA